MPNTTDPNFEAIPSQPAAADQSESTESFADMLTRFERSHAPRSAAGQQITGTVIALSADTVFLDIAFKTEGILPLALFTDKGETVSIGDKLPVSVKGRNPEGYYELSRIRVEQPKDWFAMEQAFSSKSVIVGTVTAVVKGGLTVDIGLRAFMPASRSGATEAELPRLVGQEIRCRITRLDEASEDVVVDRRSVLEEEARATTEQRFGQLNVGDILSGTVRSLTPYGAFIDLGGIDGLLHIGEISWSRVEKPEDILSVGRQIDVKLIKIEPDTRRLSLSLKQLLPHPWESVPGKYSVGDRVRGTVARLTDFGAFLELEPGVEGMIHISEMSWGKKVRKPEDMLKLGDTAEAVILGIDSAAHRISLGLKQALGDPWVDAAHRFTTGSVVEGEVTSFTKFGAFLQLTEGVQGLIHISEIAADRRLNHPSDELRLGQRVQAKVLDFDKEKRQLRLSIKQLVPTGLDDFLAEHQPGDTVTGRIVSVSGGQATVELGEGILAISTLTVPTSAPDQPVTTGTLDLSSLTSMLSSRWKSGGSSSPAASKPEQPAPGQIRSFRIRELDAAGITLDLQP